MRWRDPNVERRALLLTRSEVGASLDPAALMPEMREAFGAYSLGRDVPARRARSAVRGPENRGEIRGPRSIAGGFWQQQTARRRYYVDNPLRGRRVIQARVPRVVGLRPEGVPQRRVWGF